MSEHNFTMKPGTVWAAIRIPQAYDFNEALDHFRKVAEELGGDVEAFGHGRPVGQCKLDETINALRYALAELERARGDAS